MKIAFDAKRITHNATGLGNYSRYVVSIISKLFPENEYLLYTPSKGKKALRKRVPLNENITFHFPKGTYAKGFFKSFWRTFGIAKETKKQGVSIFHGLSNELPFGLKNVGVKSVVTIHDLIFLRYPSFYPFIDRHIYSYKFKRACKKADQVIAISEMTKRDIVSYFDIPQEKINVIYQGCDHSFAQVASDAKKKEVKSKYNLPDRYILYVGSIESRKNLLLVVRALGLLKEKIHLIAIGKQTPYAEEVKKEVKSLGLNSTVSLLTNIPFEDLPTIYQMASLFTYPSFFEGFGIPIIEALHSGIPVIAATGSCLEEAGGPHSIYVDPNNVEQMGEAITKVLSNPDMANEMIVSGKEYVKRFSDEIIAGELMELYKKTIEQH